jgi:hypothetical protein
MLINTMDASVVAPLIAQGVNENATAQDMIRSVMAQLDADTAATIAWALNANPQMTTWLLQALDPGIVAGLLNANPDLIASLLSNLDGEVIADALNAEYARHPGSSLIERILGSDYMSGANLANSLDAYGFDFLRDLMANLDGTVIAGAINGNPGAIDLVGDLVAWMNPYFVKELVNRSDINGALKNLWLTIQAYRASNILLLIPTVIQIRRAEIYVPPNRPTSPPPW